MTNSAAPNPWDVFDVASLGALSHDAQRAALRAALAVGLAREMDLESESVAPAGWLAFVLRHRQTGTLLQLVPGGSFVRGLSDAEESALRAELEAAADEDAAAGLAFLDAPDIARPTA